jgi:hypothetical protein
MPVRWAIEITSKDASSEQFVGRSLAVSSTSFLCLVLAFFLGHAMQFANTILSPVPDARELRLLPDPFKVGGELFPMS